VVRSYQYETRIGKQAKGELKRGEAGRGKIGEFTDRSYFL
jgi:hypothetical protein